jgi:hypothetical protein
MCIIAGPLFHPLAADAGRGWVGRLQERAFC